MRRGAQRAVSAAVGALFALVVAVPAAFADSIRDLQWHLKSLDVAAVQKVTTGTGVVVAVIDSGVKADHRDLTGSLLPGSDFVKAGTKGLIDTDGHGTAMAALIAGHGHGPGDGAGALGIAPGAKVMPIRVVERDLRSAAASLPDAIDRAVEAGAEVISMSLVATGTARLKRSLARALKADIVLVAAAGNRPDDIFLQYPAKYPGVVAVGATGKNGKVAPFSVGGPETVLTAPGARITSSSATGGYLTGDGTSNSTAIVAGAAALIRSKYPGLPATEVVHRLTATATDKGPRGRDEDYGFGVLNLLDAVTADVKPAAAAPTASARVSKPASPSSAVAAPPAKSLVQVNWVAVGIAVALVALLIVAVIVLIGWWLVRRRRRRVTPPGFTGSGGYPPPEQQAGGYRRGTFRP